jgi:hypothetical protein
MKVFASLFSKSDRGLGAEPQVAPAGAKYSTRRLICEANPFFFAPAVSKRTETVFSHNIKTAVGRGLAPAVQNKKEATLYK